MNRLEFIHTGLAILGLSHFEPENSMKTDPQLLIGKGSPRLVGKNYALLAEADKAFQEMSAAAQKQGIVLKIVSSYRSFEKQKSIWNRKFSRFKSQGMSDRVAVAKIIEYSTLPGTSRHHWGTDVDIIDAGPAAEGDVLIAQKFHGNGPYNTLREWMEIHAHEYDFQLPYTKDDNRSGFRYEPWHYSYAPKSIPMLRQFLDLDHKELIFSTDLKGGAGLDQGFLALYIKSHVVCINTSLL